MLSRTPYYTQKQACHERDDESQPAIAALAVYFGLDAFDGLHPAPGFQDKGGIVLDNRFVLSQEIFYLFHNCMYCFRWFRPMESWYLTVPCGILRMADISLMLLSSK